MSTQPEQDDHREQERQGGVRIETDMWVRVIGRESEPIHRTGTISANGFFFQTESWPGQPGDIGVMEVSSEDRIHGFTTMASLVRVIGEKEARWITTERGVSFQFLPSDETTRTAIARTVRHIAEQHPEQAGDLVLEDFQRAASEGAYPGEKESATPYIEAGAEVRLVVDSACGTSKREVTGVVGDITESIQADGATRFWVPVYLVEEPSIDAAAAGAAPTDPSSLAPSTDAASGGESPLDVLLKTFVPEARSIIDDTPRGASQAGRSHLSGRLSQISMPSALWLLDQERLSGTLVFLRDGEEIVLFLSEGRVIDAESPSNDRDPRGHLSALMAWEDGEFKFHAEHVDREDRVGVATQGLLLDLAVASDEMNR